MMSNRLSSKSYGMPSCLLFLQLLNTFLEEKPWRRRASGEVSPSISSTLSFNPELSSSYGILSYLGKLIQDPQCVTKPNFIVTDQEEGVTDDVEAESDDAEDDCFDSVCAFCDNGGNILWYVFS